jgi:hypothetical protein
VNPFAALRRSFGRFSRRPRSMQVRTLGMVVVVVAGVVAWLVVAPSSPSNSTSVAAGSAPATTLPQGTGSAAIDNASLSSRGVTSTSINVVFAVVALKQLQAQLGFAQDIEYVEQDQAIHVFVNQINAAGGIDGRKINALIEQFDPTSETNMRSLCKDWTEGKPAAFVVLDGVGAWNGDNELCITQEGKTPFIGQWTTSSTFTQEGAPYLWWTGPDQSTILTTAVQYGLSSGLLGHGRKVGVIVGNRASDTESLDSALLPALRKAGIKPIVATIDADPSDTATTGAQAPLIIQELRSEGVQTVIPMIPFNVFFPVLEAETEQDYFPRLLLSDYESAITVALGLIPIPFVKALDGQIGVTTETLGGIDDDRPESQGGYDPGVRSCWTAWHKAYPKIPPGNKTYYIEEQGPIVGWCQVIHLFAAAAEKAGRNLNRRTFVQAMAGIKNFPGTYTPNLTFGPHKFSGPTEYRVVSLHNNDPKHTKCIPTSFHIPQGTCWLIVQNWRPLDSG